MGVQRRVQGVVVVLVGAEHAAADVLGTVHGLDHEQSYHFADIGILDRIHRRLQGTRAGGIQLEANLVHVLDELCHALLQGFLMAAQQSLLGEILADLLGDTHVGKQHELLDQTVTLLELVHRHVQRVMDLVRLESQLDRVDRKCSIVESALSEDLREFLRDAA